MPTVSGAFISQTDAFTETSLLFSSDSRDRSSWLPQMVRRKKGEPSSSAECILRSTDSQEAGWTVVKNWHFPIIASVSLFLIFGERNFCFLCDCLGF